jgi:hypothetical protein
MSRPICALLVLLAAATCGGGSGHLETPVAVLGRTPAAEREMQRLVRSWAVADAEDRQALEGDLEIFAERFRGDDLVPLSQVLRAYNALERGELGRARALAQDALLGPTGVTRDLGTLVVGAADRRAGRYEQALSRLEPLLHKMLDDFATRLLDEELVRAALGARRWPEALRFMEVWLREAGAGSSSELGEGIAKLLADVPSAELLAGLEVRAGANVEASQVTGARREERHARAAAPAMTRLLAQELAMRAVDDADVALAVALVERHVSLLGRWGEPVARLAVSVPRGRVLGRTVGLLVGLRDVELLRRSADVVSGMIFGLGIPGSGARLVARGDDDGAVEEALEALAADGAAVIVAGVDPEHGAKAAAFAREHELPVVLLTPDPEAGGASPFVFALGADPMATSGALADLLRARGARVVAGLGAPLVAGAAESGRLGVGLGRSCLAFPSAAEMRAERVDALVAFDGAFCATEIAALASEIGAPLAHGLGVPAPAGLAPKPRAVLAAGVFPVPPSGAPADERLRAWLEAGREAPSWWQALGRDAAVLAWRSVEGLEDTSAASRHEVRARRVQAAAALAHTQAPLWTSDATGFDRDRRLPRTVRVMEP